MRSSSARHRPATAARRPSEGATRSPSRSIPAIGWTSPLDVVQGGRVPARPRRVCRIGLGTERVPREPGQRRGERCSLLEARQRLGDGGPHGGQSALPCRQFGDRRQRGKPVGRVAAGRGVDLARQSEAFLCCVEPALVRVDAGSVEMEPGRGTTDRIQLEPLIGCRRSLVPAAEIEQGLGHVTQEDAAVRPGHAKALRDREPLARSFQRRLGAPDPIEQGGEVGVPERDPFDTARVAPRSTARGGTWRSRRPRRRSGPRPSRGCRAPGPPRTARAMASAIWIASRAMVAAPLGSPLSSRRPAAWARIRVRAAVGGCAGVRRKASSTAAWAAATSPASHRYQRSRSWSTPSRSGSRSSPVAAAISAAVIAIRPSCTARS